MSGIGFNTIALSDKAFQRPDRYRFIDLASPTGIFTGSGTNAAADRCKRIGRACNEIGLFILSLPDELNILSRISMDRASFHAQNICSIP
jgi:hypothetical protein